MKQQKIHRKDFGTELEYLIAINKKLAKDSLELARESREAIKMAFPNMKNNKCTACPFRFECRARLISEQSIRDLHCINYKGSATVSFADKLLKSGISKLEIPEEKEIWQQRMNESFQEWKGGFVQLGKHKPVQPAAIITKSFIHPQ